MLIIQLLMSLALAGPSPLDEVDAFLQPDFFEAAFRVGDEATLVQKSCVQSTCDKQLLTMEVYLVKDQTAFIRTRKSTGAIISESRMTKSHWEQNSQNMARLKINQIESYGFRIDKILVKDSSNTLIFNKQSLKIETKALDIQAKNQAGMSLRLTLNLGPKLSGLAQLILMTEQKPSGTETTQITDVVRVF